MRELKTEVLISSKPEKVWRVLIDLPGWPSWNPFVTSIEGNLKTGGELSIAMCDDNGKAAMRYKSTVTALDENNRFSFIGSMMGKFMFSAERIFEISAAAEGTRLIQREIYKGILTPLFWGKLNTRALPMLKSMNEGLKRRVEQG